MKIRSLIAPNFPWLSAKFSSLLAIPLLLGLASVPTMSAVAAPFTLHQPAAGPPLDGVVSSKTHGVGGDFDIVSGIAVMQSKSLVSPINHNAPNDAASWIYFSPNPGGKHPLRKTNPT